jgi:hypothetical protein
MKTLEHMQVSIRTGRGGEIFAASTVIANMPEQTDDFEFITIRHVTHHGDSSITIPFAAFTMLVAKITEERQKQRSPIIMPQRDIIKAN